jgi:ACS family hexuronate transporter-like MFS transporter
VFLVCALLAGLCLAAPFLPTGPVLVGLLLVTGFGSLGVFPNYYSFSQDLTVRHQGKVTGTLGCCCWMAMAGWQETIGRVVHGTGSYLPCFIVAGLAPLVGFLALLVLWGPTAPAVPASPVTPAPSLEKEKLAEVGITTGPSTAREEIKRV